MIVEKIVGNIKDTEIEETECDYLLIEWYEVGKKVLHKTSGNGVEVGIRNSSGHCLHDGDILWREGKKALVLKISDCECIALKPETMSEMGNACYEIGNRHAPLFFEGDEILTPFDEPLMAALSKCGFKAYKRYAKLDNTFRRAYAWTLPHTPTLT